MSWKSHNLTTGLDVMAAFGPVGVCFGETVLLPGIIFLVGWLIFMGLFWYFGRDGARSDTFTTSFFPESLGWSKSSTTGRGRGSAWDPGRAYPPLDYVSKQQFAECEKMTTEVQSRDPSQP
jgi:hypothetical protein